jgi:FMN-dependent dehydrogenase
MAEPVRHRQTKEAETDNGLPGPIGKPSPTAVCIGRPYLWGLGAFGQPGVERVLEILRNETRAAMQQVGAPSIKQLIPAMVQKASA